MFDWVSEYLYFYRKYARDYWNHLGPTEYLTLLILIGVIGWHWMSKGPSNKA